MNSLKQYFIYGLASSALLLSFGAHAKMINLYEQPNDSAKQVGTVDIAKGVVPIFSQQDGKWIKVGDPETGNVGWMKASEMSGESGSAVTFTSRFINNGKDGPKTYQFVTYGPQPQMSAAEQQKLLQNLQLQQQEMQKAVQQMFNNFHNWDVMANPMFLPVVYVPVPNQQVILKPINNTGTSSNSAPATTSTSSSRVGALKTGNGAIKTH